tara:strand:- start:72 stop:686 length:615 start_codon:yes stop_codon:yes gene_type:complete
MYNKKLIISGLSLLAIILFSQEAAATPSFQSGDIIFQTSNSLQSKMLERATRSKITHVGIIFTRKNKHYVAEASSRVRIISLSKWIKRGKKKKYAVMRLNEGIKKENFVLLEAYIKKQLGKRYDSRFQWGDNKIYCSELVWKAYSAFGIKLTKPKTFNDFSLGSKIVKSAIRKRYKTKINLEEPVVAPIDIFKSKKLQTVFSNY